VLPEPTTTVALPDGRVLACDDVGDPRGVAVVHLHGAPDCRLARHPDDSLAADVGVRLVAVDRPGYGCSDPPVPDLLTFGDELGLLLDGLGIERCTVTAWSAGALWALGAAVALGERVERLVTYGALAPVEAFTDPGAAAASGNRVTMVDAVRTGSATPEELADEFAMLLVPSAPVPLELARDQVLETLGPRAVGALDVVPGAIDALARSLAAAVDRHADAGLRADVVSQLTPGVEALLADVRCRVVLVHGELDAVAGPGVGDWYAARLADARVEVWEAAAHQGLLIEWPRWLRVASSDADH
jgi:pimeloyl-ACP methyl ester carboxylesterase